ncbi:hypothetical protein C1884_30505, partial [Pseudomonas sp. GW460-R15]|uniref:DoxX-like family protein n=1 Tax=Pseudomonas sp. GW460-R15 TaxID=2075557 RepID=UPI000CD3A68A
LFPGVSPAEDLAGRTINALSFGFVPPSIALKGLAVWECMIGLGLLSGRRSRLVLGLLLLQMAGTLTPLILFPSETWVHAPFEPTMLG